MKVINVFANDFMLNLQSYELNKKFSVLSHYCVVKIPVTYMVEKNKNDNGT